MATAPPADPVGDRDYFALSLAAARRLRCSPADLVRLEAVRLQLAARGISRTDGRIPLWTAPVICRSPEAYRSFMEGFPDDGEMVEEAGSEKAGQADPGNQTQTAAAAPQRDRRKAWLAASALLALAAIALLAFYLWPDPIQQKPDTVPIGGGTARPLPGPGQTQVQFRWTVLLWLMLPVAAAIAYVGWLRRRRREIRRSAAPTPERSVKLAFAIGLAGLFTAPAIRRTLGRLRRHRSVASLRLNIPATIRATVTAAGFPELRFGVRPRSPDYLVMGEREAPGDHLALVGRLLSTRLAEEQVAHSHYEFFGDPRRLQPIERGAPAPPVPLTTALSRHDGARLMLFVESHDCFGEDASPEWLARIAETDRPALLDPRTPESWGNAEGRVHATGLGVFPLTDRGLAAYGDFVNRATDAGRAPPAVGALDLPESFASARDLLLGNEAPDALLVSELVADLDTWLDPAGRYWLRAVALFPYMDPGLTVFLGTALAGPDGAPLMEEQRFLRLARLPWFRAGRMPDWLRRQLVRRLSPDQLRAATSAIQAFLLPMDDADEALAINLARGQDRRLRKRLLDWLKLSPESMLSDQLLIEALEGRRPDQLGIEAPSALIRRVRALWASSEARAVLAALAAMVAIAAWQWPMTDLVPAGPTGDVVDANTFKGEVDVNTLDPANVSTNLTDAGQVDEGSNASVGNSADGTGTTIGNVIDPQPAVPLPGPFITFFDWDRDEITPQAAAILDNAANGILQAQAQMGRSRLTVMIAAYTDREFDQDYSVRLTQSRANNVRAYLVGRGVPAGQIVAMGYGHDPRVLVETADGLREPQQRRAEITVGLEAAQATAD